MENTIKLIAETLSARNQILKPKANSVFEYVDLYQADTDKMQEISIKIAEKLTAEVSLIKTKLLPLMKEINSLVVDKLASYTSQPDSTKFKIVEFDMPVIVNSLHQSGTINPVNAGASLGEDSLYVPVVAPLELSRYLELDTPVATNNLHVILGKYSDDYVNQLWEKYLTNISSKNMAIFNLISNPINNIDDIIILFALVLNLSKSKPGNVDADDEKYFNKINLFKSELARVISLADKLFNTHRANGKLIIGYSEDGYTIKVDEKLYQSYIDSGNTPEAILGLAVSDYRNDIEYTNMDKIIASKDILAGEWKKKLNMERYSEAIKNVDTHRLTYGICLPDIINLIPQDLQELLLDDEANMKARLDEKVKTEKDSEVIDTVYMSREIVGYVLFPQTSFHRFTRYMMEIEKLNPEFEPNEIANFATVELLLTYLTEQIEVGE